MWSALRRRPAACATCRAADCTSCTPGAPSTSPAPSSPRQFAHITHTLASFPPSSFCATCQRNQELICHLLAAYETTESDSDTALDQYAERLRKRYPVVCKACQVHVDKRLQEQAQRMWRRQLAGALARSESGLRSRAAWEIRPTLRRKRMVAAWMCAAALALSACLAAWTAYYRAYYKHAPDVLLVCAVVTYAARHINPLWLHVAGHPGVRIRGLRTYRQRVTLLAVWRLAGYLVGLFAVSWAFLPSVWVLVATGDVAGLAWALSCVRTHATARRVQGTLRQPAAEDSAAEEDPVGRVDAGDAIAAFGGLSFGPSEANRDQDDSRIGGAPGLSPNSRWGRRPSARRRAPRRKNLAKFGLADSSGSDMEPLAVDSLGALSLGTRSAAGDAMDVDLAPLSAHALPVAPTVAESPRPFQAARFAHGGATGLETKMQSFSISDDDYDKLQGHTAGMGGPREWLAWVLALAAVLSLAVLVAPDRVPPWVLWPQRMLTVASLAMCVPRGGGPAANASGNPGLGRRHGGGGRVPRGVLWLGAVVLTAWLAAVPVVLTMVEDGWQGHVQQAVWLRWPLARVRMAPSALVPLPNGGRPLLVYLDCAADLVALAYSAVLAYC